MVVGTGFASVVLEAFRQAGARSDTDVALLGFYLCAGMAVILGVAAGVDALLRRFV